MSLTVEQTLQTAQGHRMAGRLAEAEGICQQVLGVNPDHAGALALMAAVSMQGRRPDVGIELLSRALAQQPAWEEAWGNFALALNSVGRYNDAVLAAQRAIQLNPGRPDHYFNLGMAQFAQGQFAQAATSFDRATRLRAEYPEAHANLGVVLAELGQVDDAVASLRRAALMAPDRASFWSNLGTVLSDSGDLPGAILACRRALALQGEHRDAWNGLGMALARAGEFREAMDAFDRSLSFRGDDAVAHWNKGLLLLLQGDFERGWVEYEWRLRTPRHRETQQFSQPVWEGSPLNGRTLLIQHEQGFGDFLQFIRYATGLAEGGARIIVGCFPELKDLAASVPGVERVILPGETLPPFDVRCALLSLPLLLKTDLDSIPGNVPYIRADGAKVSRWEKLMNQDRPGRKVGLVWAGRRTHAGDRRRSLPASALSSFAGLRDVALYSLQKNEVAPSLRGLNLIDRTAQMTDFAETAAMIANLDLVIAADTAVAHLAGAMGKPVWVMLPYSPDWRWMLGREDSPWYPSMRLFRQPQLDDWEPVIARIADELNR